MEDSIESQIIKTQKQMEALLQKYIKQTSATDIDGFKNLEQRSKALTFLKTLDQRTTLIHDNIINFIDKEQPQLKSALENMEKSISEVKRQITSFSEPATVKKDEYTLQPKGAWVRKSQLGTQSENPTAVAVSGASGAVSGAVSGATAVSPTASAAVLMQADREAAPGVFIKAYTIHNPNECHKFKGFWCWSVLYNRFYISINNFILESIVCNIHKGNEKPIKFLEHHNIKRKGHCRDVDWNSTDFYVPRAFNPMSDDRRALTNRAIFVPASEEPHDNEIYIYRIGSRQTLSKDLPLLTDSDYRLYSDMTGSHLLCFTAASMVIKQRLD